MSRERDPKGRVSFEGPDSRRSQMRSGKPAAETLGEGKPAPLPVQRTSAPPPQPPSERLADREAPEAVESRKAPTASRPSLPDVVAETTPRDRDRGLEDARGRGFRIDDYLGTCFKQAFNQRSEGRSLSLHVAESRQFEGAVLADVLERNGLLPKRTGTGSDLDRAKISILAVSGKSEKELQAEEAVYGRPLAAFNQAFRESLATMRRQILGSENDLQQAEVAQQLLVQDGNMRFVDPATGAVRTAYALRIPGEGGHRFVGIASSSDGFSLSAGEGVKIVVQGKPSDRGGFEPEVLVDPTELGMAELAGNKSIVRGAVVTALQARGVEFVTSPVIERDLLKGTKLQDQDGIRNVIAEAFSEALQRVVDSDEIRDALEAPETVGVQELLRRNEAFTAAILVSLYRVDQSTLQDLESAKAGRWVDPVSRLTLAMRATLASAGEKSELMESVEAKIRETCQAMKDRGRRPNSDDFVGRMLWDLGDEVRKADRPRSGRSAGEESKAAFDVVGALGKTFARMLENADDRKDHETEPREYGNDLALVHNRCTNLTAALGDIRAVAERVGLGPKELRKFDCAQDLFDTRLDTEVGRGPESLFSRQFGATHRTMRILMKGEVEGDVRVHDHPLFEKANLVMDEAGGLMQRHVDYPGVNAHVAMIADAVLLDASAQDLERNRMGGPVLTGIQDLARMAVADEIERRSGRGDMKPVDAQWYKIVRDRAKYVLQGHGIASEEDLVGGCSRLRSVQAKALLERMKALPMGAFYGGLQSQMRLPGYPIRLGKVNASFELGIKDVPSAMPDVPNFPTNPSSYQRLLQLRGDDGKPSGTYISLRGVPSDIGTMEWASEGLLKRPKAEIPAAVAASGHTRVEIMHKSMDLPSGVKMADLASGRVDVGEMAKAVCSHFRDVPLRNDRFLTHGYLVVDPKAPAGLLGVHFPAGAYRPMNLNPGRGGIIPVRNEKTQAILNLVPLNATKNALDPKREPVQVSFSSVQQLQDEFEKRMEIVCRSYGIEEGSESFRILDQARNRIVQHASAFLEPEVLRQPMLALMPAGQARQKPSCLLVMPMKGERVTAWDPVACQRAYANLTSQFAAVGVNFDAYITKGGHNA